MKHPDNGLWREVGLRNNYLPLLFAAVLLLSAFSVKCQSYTTVNGRFNYADSIKFSKLKNNAALDSVLTTDTNGRMYLKIATSPKSIENFQGAKVITTAINYVATTDDCTIVFTNNSTGTLDWVDTRFNKFTIVNQTDNIRSLINSKSYINLTGTAITSFPARSSVTIIKGMDGIWYLISITIDATIPKTGDFNKTDFNNTDFNT